jgi:hypothetical protein
MIEGHASDREGRGIWLRRAAPVPVLAPPRHAAAECGLPPLLGRVTPLWFYMYKKAWR